MSTRHDTPRYAILFTIRRLPRERRVEEERDVVARDVYAIDVIREMRETGTAAEMVILPSYERHDDVAERDAQRESDERYAAIAMSRTDVALRAATHRRQLRHDC